MFDRLTELVAIRVLRNELRLQRKIGYKFVFKNLPSTWINGFSLVNMTLTWHLYGLPIKGLNYFTMGSIKNGLSSRFSPNSDLYQAWLGGYIFQSKDHLYWHSDDYVKLGEADQEGWLRQYGDSHPQMDFNSLKKVEDLTVSGKKAQLLEWVGITQSDVGNSAHGIVLKVMMDGMAYMMNALTPGLKMRGRNFIPHKAKIPYQKLKISGYMLVINVGPRTKAVGYVCMVGNNKPDHATMKRLITENIELVEI